MKIVSVHYHGLEKAPVIAGEITWTDNTALFQYDSHFLDLGLNLSPFALKQIPELQESKPSPFNGLHGLFADSLPDGWGMLIMDRTLKQHHIDIADINPVDRLAFVGDRAMGALTYHPDEGAEFISSSKGEVSIDSLAEESIKIYTGEVDDVLDEVADSSMSPSGARPKSLIALSGTKSISGTHDAPKEYEHWMAKFPVGKYITQDNLLEVAKIFSITKKQVTCIVEEVSESMDVWFAESKHYAIPKPLMTEISKHINMSRDSLA